jgi:YD repeat-containing protein
MFTLGNFLEMRSPLRLAVVAALILTSPATAQTFSSCNPTTQSGCAANPALGRSVTIDFANGASDEFTATSNPTYGSNGAEFTVAQSGNAPTLSSKWYIMFGKYSITTKAAPGTGIVSSAVLLSDALDEIDWEWLGGAVNEVQTNYFRQGQTTTYDRAAIHAVSTNTQTEWHTYTTEWTENQIIWSVDDTVVRVLNAGDANGQYPQTPMQLRIGSWAGGDAGNSEGTIAWAGGATDYSAGPFTMYVSSISVVDYSTGTSYSYGDQSGNWESIVAAGGAVNGNSGGSVTVTDAPAITATISGNDGWTGTHRTDTATVSYTTLPGLPSGWTISGSGKVVPSSATTVSKTLSILHISTAEPVTDTLEQSPASPSTSVLPSRASVSSPAASCTGSGFKTVKSYDQQGFLTTVTVPAGASTGWDNQGLPTTAFPSACITPAVVAGSNKLAVKLADSAEVVTGSYQPSSTATLITQTIHHSAAAGSIHELRWVGASFAALGGLAIGFCIVA